MAARAVRFVSILAISLLTATWGTSAQVRSVETTENGDYFGFDLRTERDVSLDQCTQACLADSACRAFTYNTRASWCFLKSDYSVLNRFEGAVAGRVVTAGGEDIGAAPDLPFVSAAIADEARQYRAALLRVPSEPALGLVHLTATGFSDLASGDARAAAEAFRGAIAIDPEDAELWSGLTEALLAVEPSDWRERSSLPRDASSAAFNAYRASRSTAARGEALAWLARALAARDLYRPSIEAYDASLALVDSGDVRAEQEDLRERRGFRVMDNTVDTESVSPRICVQFSEELARSGVDYADYVMLDGAPAPAVEARENQLCVDGLSHGAHYAITLRQGLPAAVGEALQRDVALSIYVRDRSPTIRFTGENFVLPSTARRGIPFVSVNAESAEMALHRVNDRSLAQLIASSQFLRQLAGYEVDTLADTLGEPIWQGTIEIAGELNRDVVTSFPVDQALPEREPGVYVLTATAQGSTDESWQARATQWFVVSDIGLTTLTGQDGLNVFARSLATARPLNGVELQLLARNNEILATAETDSDGHVRFDAGLVRGTGGTAPALVMASSGEGDFVFLDMTRAGFDLSDRGVEGRANPGAIDVFSWTERGIYRTGETVHATALARDDAGLAIENLPLTFILFRPDGKEDRRVVADGRALGAYAVELEMSEAAMRGTWSLRIHTDPARSAISSLSFLVEDFVPDRIEFDLSADAATIDPEGVVTAEVDGRFLYGAPAAGLRLEGEIGIRTSRSWGRFPGFVFGLADEEDVGAVVQPLEDLPPTDADGRAAFEVALAELPSTTRLLEAELVVRMREAGGRAVERRLTLPVTPEGDMLGIRPDFSGGSVPENSLAAFSIIHVGADGERIAAEDLAWTLVKLERNYQWYRTEYGWNYEPVDYTSRVATGTLDVGTAAPGRIELPVSWGRYRLEIGTDDPLGAVASIEFDAGWYVETSSTETPDALEIALDRERYEAGDTARLQVTSRVAGELLIAIGSERLLQTITASVPEGGSEITFDVDSDWGAGAYVMATLFRPGEDVESRLPARAIGVKWLGIDPAERKLAIALDLPEMATPRAPLAIPVSVPGAAGGTAYVTVAAVDVGILNLTGYTPPEPSAWYFGQRRLGLEIRDLYGRLIDGSLGAMGRLRTGGDGDIAVQGRPPTEQLLAFFSGIVRLDDEGRAEIVFDLPEFNGTARVMAVAWTRDGVGEGTADVVIRDPVVVTAGVPRFLAPGDTSQLRLDIANTDGPAGDWRLTFREDGTAGIDLTGAPSSVALAAGGNAALTVPLSASATGESVLTVGLEHEDGTRVERSLFLTVRPAALPVAERRTVALAANGGAIRIDGGLLGSSLLDGAYISLGVSPLSAFDIASVLMTLDRYPYGCAEQITSRALPLLYASDLSRRAGMPVDEGLDERLADAIRGVLNFQSSSGTFGLWGPGWGNMWLDAYVGDFLTRAAELGHDVPRQQMALLLDSIGNRLAYTTDVQANGSEIAYGLYVLARNRRASVGDLRYYADTRLDEFASALARAQLGAALALYGDVERAERAFASALSQARSGAADDLYRSDFGSALRDGAAILALAAETRPAPSAIPALLRFVEEARIGRTATSTQEEAWMLLAARALTEDDGDIRLEIDGVAHEGSYAARLDGRRLTERPVTLVNRSAEPVDLVITTVAAPADPLPAGGDGFEIERTYFTLDGEPVNVTEVVQNERYVVVLRFTELNKWPSQVVVTDLLPAGFEIDNPRLVGSADLSNFDWLGTPDAAHVEFRYDRFTAAFERTANSPREQTAAYVVRAVTPGVYAHPAAIVEDMYRPQFSARTAAGAMEVLAPQ